jgi:hypothetical protein
VNAWSSLVEPIRAAAANSREPRDYGNDVECLEKFCAGIQQSKEDQLARLGRRSRQLFYPLLQMHCYALASLFADCGASVRLDWQHVSSVAKRHK